MSVLHVVSHRRPGGALVVADTLADRLPGRGRVLALTDLSTPDSRPRGAANTFCRTTLALARVLRSERPQAVVAHTPRAALLTSVVALATRVKTRMVVQHATSRALGRVVLAADALAAGVGIHSDVVFVGEAVRATFPSRPYSRRGLTIRNGVDTAPHHGRAAGTTGGAFTVVTTGSLTVRKNHAVLVRACAEAAHVSRLVVLGDGPERARLRELAIDLGLELVLPGHVPPATVADYMSAADVFAFPSLDEALPLALIESAQLGCAVVASDIPANREVLESAAVYRAADDVDGWAGALDLLASDRVERARLKSAATERGRLFRTVDMLEAYARALGLPGVVT